MKPYVLQRSVGHPGRDVLCLTPESELVGLNTSNMGLMAGLEHLTDLYRISQEELEQVKLGRYAAIFDAQNELDESSLLELGKQLIWLRPKSIIETKLNMGPCNNPYSRGEPVTKEAIKQSPYVTKLINELRRDALRRKIKSEKHSEGTRLFNEGASINVAEAYWNWNGKVLLPEEKIPVVCEDDEW